MCDFSIGCEVNEKSERRPFSRVSYRYFLVQDISKMDQRDQDLLDKQIGRLTPAPRNGGVMILAILAVFFSGIALGGFLVGYKSGPTRIAANNAIHAMSFPRGAPPILWQ